MKIHRVFLTAALFCLSPLAVQAEGLNLPPSGSDVVGSLRYIKAHAGETLIDIAHEFSQGQEEIVMANPNVSRWLPGEGTKVLIPDRFILPDAPRSGIVVNVPEMRLYFYPPGDATNPAMQVITYPISVGRMDWKSPMGVTKIVEKIKNPTWTPPESIKREHAKDGDILPDVVPAGPDNPLGLFAMRLGVKGSYLIHGTDQAKADGIGMMVTHGCIRMYPEDVAQLFPKVSVGTQVNLLNQPVKVGWLGNVLYIEVSQPMDEDHLGYDQLLSQARNLIAKKTAGRTDFELNQEALREALQKPNGIPHAISGGAVGAALAAQGEKIPLVSRSSSQPIQMIPAPPISSPAISSPPVAIPPVSTPVPAVSTPTPAIAPAPVPVTVAPAPAAVMPVPAAPVRPALPPAEPLPGPTPKPSSSRPEEQLLPPIY